MIQRKHTFRLRIPWLFAPSSRVSKSEDRSKFSTHSDTNFPIQRPISPSTKTKEPSNFEPKRNSPSHHTQPTTTSVFIESSVPSRASSSSRVSIASSSPKTRPQSPSHLASDGIIEMGKLAAEERFWPASSAAFELDREEKFVSKEPIPQEAEPKAKASSPLKSIAKSSSWETAFQPEKVKPQPQDTEQKASSVLNSVPVSKTEPASNQSSPPLSPLASEYTGKALNRNADESASPASLASQEEKELLVQQETESKEKSQLEAIIKSSETSFQPENMSKQLQETELRASSEPSTPVSKITLASNQPPHTSSPLASTLTSEMLKRNAKETTLPESPSYEPMLQDFESKMKSPLKIIPNSPETSSKPKTKKPDSDGIAGSSKAPLETQTKLLESEEKEKKLHEPIKARKAKDIRSIISQPNQHTMESASSGSKDRDPFTMIFRADKNQHEAHEAVARRLVSATSKLRERDIKFMSSADQITRTVSNILVPEKSSLQNGIKRDVSEFVHKFRQLSAITLAGENRGASMQLVSDTANKDDSFHIHHDNKVDLEENIEVITDLEEKTKKESHCLTKGDDGVGKAYVNSNVQSINNSLMVHGSVTKSG